MRDVTPLLADEREDEAGALWATKQYGDFKEGDRLRAPEFVTGSVEVRHIRSVYKLSFLDIALVNRFTPEGAGRPQNVVVGDAGDESMSGEKAREVQDAARLYVFLTKKKAKPRMADLEETAYMLRLDVGSEGCICSGGSFGDFDQGMLHVPDPVGYRGIIIAKRRVDAPLTEEPIVYAYAKMVPKRRPVVASEVILGLAEDKDRVNRHAKATKTLKTDRELIRGARKYTRTARKAWEALSIPEDQEIDLEDFKRAFDGIDIVLVEARAMRLFRVCDLDGSRKIGISEMEMALMVHDVVPNPPYLTPLDAFFTFDLDGGGDISWVEFKEAAEVIAGGRVSEQQAKQLFDWVDTNKSGAIEYEEFKEAWVEMVDLPREMSVRGLKPASGPLARMRNKRLLLKAIKDEDRTITDAFRTVRGRVDDVRRKARLLRERKKKRKAATRGKSSLQDASEDATRKRQRRLMIQREQAARARQRVEQKIKENELQQQLQAKKERDTVRIKQRIAQEEKERVAGIRARLDDQLWLSRLNLRQVPEEFYRSREAQEKLMDIVLLDLQDNRLVELPDDFLSQMVSLRKLSLNKNRLSFLSDEHLINLRELQVLHLHRNELRNLPSAVGSLLKLQHLNISKNDIEHLPDELGRLSTLRSVTAHSNSLRELPSSVGGLVSLESCDLSGNRLGALANEFSYATALTRLDISRNRLQYLPLDFGQLFSLLNLISPAELSHIEQVCARWVNTTPELSVYLTRNLYTPGSLVTDQVLDVSCNCLSGLPDSVSTLRSLKILKLGENEVAEVSPAWGGMTNLVELEAHVNCIGRVSPGIGGMLQLQRLDLHRNLIEELPPEIGLLTKLHELELRSNRISTIPDEMGALVGLHHLSMRNNRLEHRLTDHVGLLTRLTHLDLLRNRITHLPPSLGGLEDLGSLNLSRNFLSSLPQNFAFLRALTDLDLSSNRFSTFPEALCRMSGLRRLDITSNALCRLPREIGALTGLTRLHLRHNLLKSLPLEMVELEKHVRDLSVEHNPLPVLPSKWYSQFGPKKDASKPPGYTHGEAKILKHLPRVIASILRVHEITTTLSAVYILLSSLLIEVYEWLRAQSAFHQQATEEWDHKAGLYLTARASAKEFVDAVRARVGEDTWRSHLEPHVLRFFFRAKRTGMPDAHEQLSTSEIQERQELTAALDKSRADKMMLSAAAFRRQSEQRRAAYSYESRML